MPSTFLLPAAPGVTWRVLVPVSSSRTVSSPDPDFFPNDSLPGEPAEDPAIGNRRILARAEDVAERPAFRAAFQELWCLIVADGLTHHPSSTTDRFGNLDHEVVL